MASDILLKGEVDIPSSKSFAQRAILLAALAEGTTRLYNLTLCDDTQSALSVAWQLGAEISFEGRTLILTGHQRIQEKGLVVKDNKLFVGESGLLARLCIPLAGLSDSDILIVGEKTLNRRKIREHAKALRWMGLKISYNDEHYLPASVSGRLNGRIVNISGARGSQMISGMLLALSQCAQDSVLHVDDPTSNPYIDLTIYLAEFFGIDIDFSGEENEESRSFFISGKQQIKPLHGLEVEKDWSAAAIMLVAGAMMGDITIRGMDMFSNQADAMIYDFLEQNHVDIVKDKDGNINIRKSIICPFVYDITDAPDLFAPLFLLATRATGESCIQGIRRLRNKESDRARSFAQEFRKLGVWVEIRGDYMLIRGNEDFEFMGAECSSHGDHRLAMVLSIANLLATSEIIIDDTDCINKSFPGFLTELAKLDQRKLN
jgi:3-phosphoshikimate 1-carboxyvinyltransferase